MKLTHEQFKAQHPKLYESWYKEIGKDLRSDPEQQSLDTPGWLEFTIHPPAKEAPWLEPYVVFSLNDYITCMPSIYVPTAEQWWHGESTNEVSESLAVQALLDSLYYGSHN